MRLSTVLAVLAMLAGLFLASAASAGTGAVILAAPDLGEMLYSLIANYGGTAMSWALTGLAAAGAWLLVRIGAAAAWRSLIEELGAHAKDVVLEVWQTYVEAIKAGRADGKLEPEEKNTARELALAKLKARLSWRKLLALGGGLLGRIFGASTWAAKVENMLGGAVETAIAESKREGKAAGLSTTGKDLKAEPPPLPPR